MKPTTLLSILLEELDVPFTPAYTDKAFRTMAFPSLFGLVKLLGTYGIDAEGYALASKADIAAVPAPFVAGLTDGTYCVVSRIEGDRATMRHPEQGTSTIPISDLADRATGNIVAVYPSADSIAHAFGRHSLAAPAREVKPWLLAAVMALICVWLIV
ncbi:MAG: hypothetical protein K2H74_07030, partial [Paramuribaculum sp.]|nr:hypothetical protein [Paramuribaculum sp.]